MFAANPVPTFAAKLSIGRECGLLFLSPANSNSAGNQFNRRPGNESDEAISNGADRLQGAETWQQIGAPVERIVSRLKEKADREDQGEVRHLPASKTAQGARRAVNS